MNWEKQVCAVVITYNPQSDIINGINSILMQNQINSIIIVDNGSKETSKKIIKDLCFEKKLHLIENNVNEGIAKALNIGVKEAISKGYKWILTLDQDSVLTEFMLEKMLFAYEKIENKDEVMILAPENIEKEKFSNKVIFEEKVTEMLSVITSGNLVKSQAFEKIGFFEEKLFIDLVDHDYCLKVNKNGYKIIKVSNAILLHSLGETKYNNFFGKKVSTSNHSALRRYYMSRNRIYIWRKYSRDFSVWIKNDKKMFRSEIIRIILFENKKIEKIKMIILGIIDGKNNVYGEFTKEK